MWAALDADQDSPDPESRLECAELRQVALKPQVACLGLPEFPHHMPVFAGATYTETYTLKAQAPYATIAPLLSELSREP